MKLGGFGKGWLAQRVHVSQLGDFKLELGLGGVLCVGVRAAGTGHALVAICDETETHGGGSATNAMEGLLTWLKTRWEDSIDLQTSNVIELDSMGYWDRVTASWESGRVTRAAFSPIRAGASRPRSDQAMLLEFGDAGLGVLMALKAMDATCTGSA